MMTNQLSCGFKTRGLVEADDFSFVGKQDVDVVLDQLKEAVAMTINAEGI